MLNALVDEWPTRAMVRDYYGHELRSSADLKTNACCPPESVARHHRPILAGIPDEVLSRSYGCGSPIPPALEGCTVLDLGCGTGKDAFLASALVGKDGNVIGVDMTEEQLEFAWRFESDQAERFGYSHPNTSFRLGGIEDLLSLGIEDESIDVVISNCVINLSERKKRVFDEIFRVLKPGGELFFSDVFCNRRLAEDLRHDPVLLGECLGGALYEEDFRRLLTDVGCPDFRIVAEHAISVSDPTLEARLGDALFTSRTIRAFKLSNLEDRCEDFGQVAYYRGGIEGSESAFVLDDHHRFETGSPMLVCGNTAAMLERTRYAPFFKVVGDRRVHYGLFDGCVTASANETTRLGSCC